MTTFDEPTVFPVGTVGPPGQRVFYLQVGHGGSVATFKLEKQQVAALAAEAKQVRDTRAARAKSLPDGLLALYEKLRASKGTGAALLQRGRCTGCQLEIPVSDLDRYRKAPANEVLRCAHCDRILIRTDESGL